MGPSWGKMVWGSELDGIFGHLRRKMAVKLEVRRKMLQNISKTNVFNANKGKEGGQHGPKMVPKRVQDGPKMAEDGAKTASWSSR